MVSLELSSRRSLGRLLNNFGAVDSLSWSDGNLNGDLVVDSTDLGQLLNNFGFLPSPAANLTAVPEPVGMLLWSTMLAIGVLRRRKL